MTSDHSQRPIENARVLLAALARETGLLGDPATSSSRPQSSEEATFVPFYPDAGSWVTNHYTVVYVRRLKASERWCASWFEHPEAVMRFEALWRTWEAGRLNELTGTAGWLRDELDHHMPILHSDSGPFAGCVAGEHRLPNPEVYPILEVSAQASAARPGTPVGGQR
jgi:hypothetical protein